MAGKAGCNILMSASPMTINWPKNEDASCCDQTSNGHTGRLQVPTYVSMPLFERRLIFYFTTYEQALFCAPLSSHAKDCGQRAGRQAGSE
jgi:hypothetical protein